MPDGNVPKPAKVNQAKGKPWIYWIGKRGLEEVPYFPAQETERFDPDSEIDKGGWSNLLFHGDNKEVMGHLLNEFRGQVILYTLILHLTAKLTMSAKWNCVVLRENRIAGKSRAYWSRPDSSTHDLESKLSALRELRPVGSWSATTVIATVLSSIVAPLVQLLLKLFEVG